MFYNPALPSVHLELGVLYFKLGAYDVARSHFEAVASNAGSDEQRSRAALFLKEIEKRTSRVLTTGTAQFGGRAETNANAGTREGLQTATDPALLTRFQKRGDYAAFGSLTLNNFIDFGNQRGDVWETFARVYGAAQRDLHYLNTGIGEVTTGPRFSLFPEYVSGWSIRPFVGLGGIHLGGSGYLFTRTAGTSLAYIPEPGWLVEVGGDRSQREFYDSPNYPTAADQSGFYNSAWGLLAGRLPWGMNWSARFTVSDNNSRLAYLGYLRRDLVLSVSKSFYANLGGRDWALTVSPFLGFATAHYNEADPLAATDIVRRDTERRAGVNLELVQGESWGVALRAQYSQTHSTLRDFQYDNFLLMAGPVYKF